MAAEQCADKISHVDFEFRCPASKEAKEAVAQSADGFVLTQTQHINECHVLFIMDSEAGCPQRGVLDGLTGDVVVSAAADPSADHPEGSFADEPAEIDDEHHHPRPHHVFGGILSIVILVCACIGCCHSCRVVRGKLRARRERQYNPVAQQEYFSNQNDIQYVPVMYPTGNPYVAHSLNIQSPPPFHPAPVPMPEKQ
jgi:hypothetical protein